MCFPWLSNVAQCFEKYKFQKCEFTLISAQATTSAGRVYLAADPDWDDPVPPNKTAFMGLSTAVEAGVWETLTLKIPIKRFNEGFPWRYCNSSNRIGTGEPRTAFCGFMVIATDIPATVNYTWDLWVDYTVELSMPTMEENILGETFSDVSGRTSDSFSRIYPAFPLGNTGGLEVINGVTAGTISTSNPNLIRVPKSGTGLVNVEVEMGRAAQSVLAMMGAGHKIDCNGYDSNGNCVSTLSSYAVSPGGTVVPCALTGVMNPTNTGQPSTTYNVLSSMLIDIRAWLLQEAKVRFFLPFIQAGGAALLFDQAKFRVKMEL
jgi:hypothetical protein